MKTSEKTTKISEIVDRLRKASELYYNGKESGMTDYEFDELRDRLESLDPDNDFLKEVGAPIPSSSVWPKINHIMPMGSQKKIKTAKELVSWADKYTTGVLFWSDKLDGLSIELVYENGVFTRGVTRGGSDTPYGEDITPNVRLMKGISWKISYKGTVAVRSEIVLKTCAWEQIRKDKSNNFKTARNTAAGIARRKKDPSDCRHLTLYSFDAYFPDEPDRYKKKLELFEQFLVREKFTTPNFGLVSSTKEMNKIKHHYENTKRAELPYEIDGLVVEDNCLENQKALGFVDHRPRGARAYKFSSEQTETILIDVVWQVARTQIAPVAILKPVVMGGAQVARAHLCNLEEIQRLGVGIGSKVVVSRRNDITPKIEAALTGGDKPIAPPEKCPTCHAPTECDSMRVYCTNESCIGSTMRTLLHYLKALNIKGLGKKQVEGFVEQELLETPLDLYRLKPSDFSSEKIGTKVMADIKAKSRNVPVADFVRSLGISLFGKGKTEDVLKVIPTLEGIRSADVAELLEIDGIGNEVANAAVSGLKAKSGLIDALLEHVTLETPKEPAGDKFSGKSFCFTGYRNKEAEAKIADMGGKVASGVSKNTTYLVLKDVNSTSSKAQKARSLGVTLLNPEDLEQLLGE